MMRSIARAVSAAVCGGLLITAPLAQAQPLLINFDSGSAPTQYAGPNGEAMGVYPAIVRAAFQRMGEPVTLRARPFKRMMSELEAGEAGAGSLVRSAARLAVSDYSRDYIDERVSVFHLAAQPLRYTGLADLRGRRVGVIRGWSYGPAFDEARARGDFTAEDVDTDLQNFSKLSKGRLDLVIATEMAGRVLLGRAELAPLRAAPQPLIVIGIALTFNKKQQRTALLKRFDEAIVVMKQRHEIEAIVDAEIERARLLAP